MSRKMNKFQAEKDWKYIMHCMDGIIMISCITLHEHFGFGEKRIAEFLDTFTQINSRLAEYSRDEVWDQKTKEWRHDDLRRAYRKAIHESLAIFLPENVINAYFNLDRYNRRDYLMEAKAERRENERRERVSMAEAAEMQNKVQAFRRYLEDNTPKT